MPEEIRWSTAEPTIEEVDLYAKAYGHGDSEAMGELMERRSDGAVTKGAYLRSGVLQATKWMNGCKDGFDEGMAGYKEWVEAENKRRQEERERLEAEWKKRSSSRAVEPRGSLDDLPSAFRGINFSE